MRLALIMLTCANAASAQIHHGLGASAQQPTRPRPPSLPPGVSAPPNGRRRPHQNDGVAAHSPPLPPGATRSRGPHHNHQGNATNIALEDLIAAEHWFVEGGNVVAVVVGLVLLAMGLLACRESTRQRLKEIIFKRTEAPVMTAVRSSPGNLAAAPAIVSDIELQPEAARTAAAPPTDFI